MYICRALILFLLFCIFLFPGCGGDSTPDPDRDIAVPQKGGVYRRAFADSFIILDPSLIKDSNSHEVSRQIYDGLVDLDEYGNPGPSLAESWNISDNKLVYNFKLRSDVFFHSKSGGKPTACKGRKMLAKDIVYTFKRLLTPAKGSQGAIFHLIKGAAEYSSGQTKELEGVRAISEHEVEFKLNRPFAPFLVLLGSCNAFIVPREDAESETTLSEKPVGTGPFIWKGKIGDTLVIEANENYFRGRPYLDRIEFPIIPEESQRFAGFKTGNLMHVDVPDSEYKNIKQDPIYSSCLLETSRWGVNYLGMNMNIPPFDNKLVRQALNYAIDRKAIVKLVLNDRARVANGVLPPGIAGFDPNFIGYHYDLQKAKQLLQKAGYPKGKGFPEIELQYNRDIIHTRIGEFVIANLNDLGITCKVKEVDFGSHLSQVEAGKAAFFRMGWTVDYPDPDSFLYTLFHSSNIKNGYNFSGINDKKLDDLLDQARFETETKKRIELYRNAEKLIVDKAPWIFLYFYTTHLLHQPYVNGLKLGPMGQPFINYRKIWLKPRTL